MTAPARFKKADVARAISGAAAAGMRVGRVEILPDGRIVLVSEASAPALDVRNPWDVEFAS